MNELIVVLDFGGQYKELIARIKEQISALMSHTDLVTRLPDGFVSIAQTADCPYAACECPSQKLYGVQFHTETEHTDDGCKMIEHFLYDICGAKGDYRLDDYVETMVGRIRQKVAGQKVLFALSGGVDSSVCASLLSMTIPVVYDITSKPPATVEWE